MIFTSKRGGRVRKETVGSAVWLYDANKGITFEPLRLFTPLLLQVFCKRTKAKQERQHLHAMRRVSAKIH